MQQNTATIHKKTGETPLQALERYRSDACISTTIPLAYAGRLDPMAEGKLLILIGEECKKQTTYHGLDKRYEFQILFGTTSDTGDILGRLTCQLTSNITAQGISETCKHLSGRITLPYPHYSSKTVQGKPLHTWTLEGKINEINIPTYSARIYNASLQKLEYVSAREIYQTATNRIKSLPTVTEVSKRLGQDFRRSDVLLDWEVWLERHQKKSLAVASIACLCSSGLYMRSLANHIANQHQTTGLAYSIKRTHIGTYQLLPLGLGVWIKKY